MFRIFLYNISTGLSLRLRLRLTRDLVHPPELGLGFAGDLNGGILLLAYRLNILPGQPVSTLLTIFENRYFATASEEPVGATSVLE